MTEEKKIETLKMLKVIERSLAVTCKLLETETLKFPRKSRIHDHVYLALTDVMNIKEKMEQKDYVDEIDTVY